MESATIIRNHFICGFHSVTPRLHIAWTKRAQLNVSYLTDPSLQIRPSKMVDLLRRLLCGEWLKHSAEYNPASGVGSTSCLFTGKVLIIRLGFLGGESERLWVFLSHPQATRPKEPPVFVVKQTVQICLLKSHPSHVMDGRHYSVVLTGYQSASGVAVLY